MKEQNTPPLVFILLLNYRGVSDTCACLESLQTLDYPNYQVIVIDNASGDQSIDVLRQSAYPFHLIEAPSNLGFSGGNNLGIEYALTQGADFIWLLNNDTTVDPGALTHLIEEGKKTGGLVGSLVLYPDRSYQQVGTQVNWSTGSTRGIKEAQLENGMSIECLTGASLLIPKMAFKRIGLLDPSYFLYFEDGDFCLRARRTSFTTTLALRSRVYHKEGASTGKHSPNTQYYFHRNRLKMVFKFASFSQKLSLGLYTGYRYLRNSLKGLFDNSPEKKASLKIQLIAVFDFLKGVSGPCPHDLSRL